MSVIRFIFICVLSLPLANCFAQLQDTAFLMTAKNKAIALYTKSIKDQSRLYNGSDYVIYMSVDEEHPYYKIDDWENGSVTYWGERYDSIPLLYDLHKDQLVTEHNRGNALSLVQEKVQAFTLLDHTFVRLYNDGKNLIQEGYYDLLHDGQTKVYAKRSKTYGEDLETRMVVPRFDEHTRYFIVRAGIFHQVKSKAGTLKIFADRKQDIKSFIRKNNIRFQENKEEALKRVTEYYNTLN